VKRNHNRAKRDTFSIQARVVYAEHCARKGALSKANQAITSTSVPRDLMRLGSMLCPRPQALDEYWSSDAGVEFLEKWFSVAKICQYFRSRSPVTMPDVDG
jgi:hypothetical protein